MKNIIRKRNKSKTKDIKLKKGFTLIELVVSIASGSIITVGLVAMIIFISLSYNNITSLNNSLKDSEELKLVIKDELDSYTFDELNNTNNVKLIKNNNNYVNDNYEDFKLSDEKNEYALFYIITTNSSNISNDIEEDIDTTVTSINIYYYSLNSPSHPLHNFEFNKRTYQLEEDTQNITNLNDYEDETLFFSDNNISIVKDFDRKEYKYNPSLSIKDGIFNLSLYFNYNNEENNDNNSLFHFSYLRKK